MGTERAKEDEWFARNEKEMLERARVAREKREHERAESEGLEERQRVKQLHFMKCPKCGHDLAECDLEGVNVDQCSFCEGVFLDAGTATPFGSKRSVTAAGAGLDFELGL